MLALRHCHSVTESRRRLLLSVTAASIPATGTWLRHHHRLPGWRRHLPWRHHGRSLHPRLLHHLALLPHFLPVKLLLLHLTLQPLGLGLLCHLLTVKLRLLHLHLLAVGLALLPHLLPVKLLLLHLLLLSLGLALLFHLLAHHLILLSLRCPLLRPLLPGPLPINVLLLIFLLTSGPVLLGCLLALQLPLLLEGLWIAGGPG